MRHRTFGTYGVKSKHWVAKITIFRVCNQCQAEINAIWNSHIHYVSSVRIYGQLYTGQPLESLFKGFLIFFFCIFDIQTSAYACFTKAWHLVKYKDCNNTFTTYYTRKPSLNTTFWLLVSGHRIFSVLTERGNRGILLSAPHLSRILWKNASLSLASMKSKNFTVWGQPLTSLFSLPVRFNVFSLELVSATLDETSSGLICSSGLDVWKDPLVLWTLNLVPGVRFLSNVVTVKGLLNQTFFLHKMGLPLVSWWSKNIWSWKPKTLWVFI